MSGQNTENNLADFIHDLETKNVTSGSDSIIHSLELPGTSSQVIHLSKTVGTTMNSILFTELTSSEEAILSGGSNTKKAPKTTITTTSTTRSNGTVLGASGAAVTGATVIQNGSGSQIVSNATSAAGVVISN